MDDDARDVELSAITAIYPELQLDENNPYILSIEVPVTLSKPLTVLFPAVTGTVPSLALAQAATLVPPAEAEVDSQALLHLPALQVDISLPDGYPETQPPNISLSTSPQWLSNDILRKLETDAARLWENVGRDQVIFTYIDDLQRASDDVFGLVDEKGTLEVAPDHKIALLDYDINAKRIAFEKETFECGICLDPKKGIVCHKMIDCGHVFCVQCLQDFYNNAITEGDVTAVTCPAPNCAKNREKSAAEESSSKRRKLKTSVSPSELLQIPLDQDTVKRYVLLKHKTKLESDKNTIYCPRSWCQGAARSKKHKKPEGLELIDSDDEEDEDTGLLAICEDCGFAFCSRCSQGWHGEFNYCLPKERKDAITEEEKASLEYLKLHSTPCPTCAAPCQKSHGCNHMRCFRCQTHFCYLCSAWLDPSNPYKHFNTQPSGEVTSCYMRLWELEGGDGDDVGIGYEGGDVMRAANVAAGQYGEHLEIVQRPRAAHQGQEEPRAQEEPRHEVAQPAPVPREVPQVPPPRERRAVVAREGPLVLRIEGDAPVARDREEGPREAAIRAPPPANPRANNPRANAGQRGGRGNRRGRGGARLNQQNDRNQPRDVARANNNAAGMRQAQPAAAGPNGQQNPDLNAQQEAWIRHFVQLALNDEEHLVEWDSDDE
ncbi:putative ring finger protein [Rosellinia necatrix]|uniref:RBR-type E3 ubiquitin transferase n=1 Tax=Rosellinia necatrix TaxID=77044 RepID=A0A1S7UL64_ROSNE|nr:putative ring finger protein [Rosellinia necatrix]